MLLGLSAKLSKPAATVILSSYLQGKDESKVLGTSKSLWHFKIKLLSVLCCTSWIRVEMFAKHLCAAFACSPHVLCVGSPWLLQLPPTVQRTGVSTLWVWMFVCLCLNGDLSRVSSVTCLTMAAQAYSVQMSQYKKLSYSIYTLNVTKCPLWPLFVQYYYDSPLEPNGYIQPCWCDRLLPYISSTWFLEKPMDCYFVLCAAITSPGRWRRSGWDSGPHSPSGRGSCRLDTET